jgi:hypothetical protein
LAHNLAKVWSADNEPKSAEGSPASFLSRVDSCVPFTLVYRSLLRTVHF